MSYDHKCCQYFRCDQGQIEEDCEKGLMENECLTFFDKGKNSARYVMCQPSVPAPTVPSIAEPVDESSPGL